MSKNTQLGSVKYIAIGDSYTIGQGVDENERFPNMLAEHLRKEGVSVAPISNPSVSGYTTQDALEEEIPILEGSDFDFVTVLLGANDSYRDVGLHVFQTNFEELLDRIQKKLPEKNKLVVLTIPDYSSSPSVVNGGGKEMFQKRIIEYNQVIKEEAAKRGLQLVDLFSLTSSFSNRQDMFVTDGLHPSSLQYQEWEKALFPVTLKLFGE